MGWTQDQRDVSRNIRGRAAGSRLAVRSAHHPREFREPRSGQAPRIGIPRILGRRARWVGARLRHPRT
ncbi:hypothetical protein O3441_11695 [Streptomyces sp. WMMC897]|nr:MULTISPECIES: hypothetical protein [unclassified Streptomyces]MCZ7415165.1 hypothetical protein [Streptomyces sp. WMMC897]MCZ7432108.1 hypothetical protein [Streptomyces sp. WMMC1477]